MSFRSGATFGRKAICPRTSFSKSTPGAISVRSSPSFVMTRHRPLRDELDPLPGLGRQLAAERDLCHLGDELLEATLFHDLEPSIPHPDFQSAGRECPAESDRLGTLGDVHEAADARHPALELAHIDVAVLVGLRHAQEGQVEAASVVKVELIPLIQDGLGIRGHPKNDARGRNPARDALFDCRGDAIPDPLFGGHQRHAVGHADPHVQDGARQPRQLQRSAARNHLPFVERHGCQGRHRDLYLAAEGRVVLAHHALPLLRMHHDVVHHGMGDLHLLRVQRSGLGQPLHLADDDPT